MTERKTNPETPASRQDPLSKRVYDRAGELAKQLADGIEYPPAPLKIALLTLAVSGQIDALLVELDLEMARRAAWEEHIEELLERHRGPATLTVAVSPSQRPESD